MDADLRKRAKALMADILKSGELGVMFVWDENDNASFIGPSIPEADLVKLLEHAAFAFGERNDRTLQ